MKRWSTAVLPVTILLVLAALTAWLRYATEMPEVGNDGKTRHDPDSIIVGAIGWKLDANGRLQYTLVSDEIRHYPDDDTSDLRNPVIVYLDPVKPPVIIRAGHGHATSRAERVDLTQDVEIRRSATSDSQELVATMPDLTVLTDDERAFTASPALITQGASWVRGVGLQVDNRLQTYVLESRVRGQIESQYARKGPQ